MWVEPLGIGAWYISMLIVTAAFVVWVTDIWRVARPIATRGGTIRPNKAHPGHSTSRMVLAVGAHPLKNKGEESTVMSIHHGRDPPMTAHKEAEPRARMPHKVEGVLLMGRTRMLLRKGTPGLEGEGGDTRRRHHQGLLPGGVVKVRKCGDRVTGFTQPMCSYVPLSSSMRVTSNVCFFVFIYSLYYRISSCDGDLRRVQ